MIFKVSHIQNKSTHIYLWVGILVLFFCSTELAKAQDNNVWLMNTGPHDVVLDFNQEPPVLTTLKPSITRTDYGNLWSYHPPLNLCDSQGNLSVYSRGPVLFNVHDASDSIMLPFEEDIFTVYSNSYSILYSKTLHLTDNTYLLFVSFFGIDRQIDSILLNQYVLRFSVGTSLKLLEFESVPEFYHQQSLFKPYTSRVPNLFQIIPKIDGSFQLLVPTLTDSIDLCSMSAEGKLLVPASRIKWRLSNPSGWISNCNVLSNNKKHLAVLGYNDDITLSTYLIENKRGLYNNGIYLYSMNTQTGLPLPKADTVFHSSETYNHMPQSGPDQLQYTFISSTFSPNDSILYALLQDWKISKLILLQYHLETKELNLLRPFEDFPGAQTYQELKLGPNGKIYILPSQTFALLAFSNTGLGVINYPNRMGAACDIEFADSSVYYHIKAQQPSFNYSRHISNFPATSSYKRVHFTTNTACTGLPTAFTNTSDSIHWERYRFYFGDGDSADLTNNTRLANGSWGVEHTYQKAGKYLVKLRAFTQAGGWVWYSDSVTVLQASVPRFSVQNAVGCQWIAHTFVDESTLVNKGKNITVRWQFGDGSDTSLYNQVKRQNQRKTYTQSGKYTVVLTINDGFCTDSFSLENSVDILPAPRPGMVVSAKSGCTPFELTAKRTYTDDAVDLTWNFGDGSAPQIVTPSSTTSHTYLTAGSFWLTQTLLGSTGCITRDTQLIAVQQGFDPSYVPLLIRASVEPADSVEVEWMSNPLAKSYVVFQNQKVVDSTLNNYWKGGYDIPQALYNVRAQNVCGNLSTSSNIGKLIELSGQQQNNEVALLQWSAYEDWALGIARYEVETYVEDPTQLVQSPFAILSTNDSSNRSYSDLGYKTDGAAQKCYRIRAISAANAKVISYSNVVCLPYQPVFFVPSAFSPNNDGLNDQFSVYSLGIKSFEIEIFNRWGELVYRGQRWDGKIDGSIAPLGAYLFTIQGRTAEDKIVSRFGSVMLVE